VITPVYGLGWNVGENAIDRYLMPKVHARVKNRFYLTMLFWMTPCKSTANLLRWKPTYYRDRAYKRIQVARQAQRSSVVLPLRDARGGYRFQIIFDARVE
jgi:hypothetical protein